MGHHSESRAFPDWVKRWIASGSLLRGPVALQRLVWGPLKGLHEASRRIPCSPGPGKNGWTPSRGPVARQRVVWGPMKGLHEASQRFPCAPEAWELLMASGHCCAVRSLGRGLCGGR